MVIKSLIKRLLSYGTNVLRSICEKAATFVSSNSRLTCCVLHRAQSLKRPRMNIWARGGPSSPQLSAPGPTPHFYSFICKQRTDFILTSQTTLSIVVAAKHMTNNRPRTSLFMPALSHTHTHTHQQPLHVLWQQDLLLIPPDGRAHSPHAHTHTRDLQSRCVCVCGGAGETGLRTGQGVPQIRAEGASWSSAPEPVASRATGDMRGFTCDQFNYSALHS